MKLSENLQNLRRQHNISQEQLADKLEVSRQAVSKWESGDSYPETDKIIAMCELFNCKMDDLVLGEIKAQSQNHNLLAKYAQMMNSFSRRITAGVALCLLGVTAMIFIDAIGMTTSYGVYFSTLSIVVLLIFVTIAVALFIIAGLQKANFQKHYPKLEIQFPTEELERSENKFTIRIVVGITLILMGVIVLIFFENVEFLPSASDIPVALLMSFLTVGVPILVYAGLQKQKYNLEIYNLESSPIKNKSDDLVERLCGVIMILATITFLCLGFLLEAWQICWIVFPIGGMLCGITALLLKKSD